MPSTILPLSVNITAGKDARFGTRYKSISSLSWVDIPDFAILTGKNGSGKTQLLELLAFHFSGAIPPGAPVGTPLPVKIEVSGRNYHAHEIAYVPSAGRFSGGQAVSLANLATLRGRLLNQAQAGGNGAYDVAHMVRTRRILDRSNGRHLRNLVTEDLLAEIFSETEVLTDDIDVTANLALVFLTHRFKLLISQENNTPGLDENGVPFGPAPWDVLNQALSAGGFPYKVASPLGKRFDAEFQLRFIDRSSGIEIGAADLSSGEKAILQLVLWLYAAGGNASFPKLLLLDEPDAHLHPSMTTQFLDVISHTLVARYGVRVIMTTHSPSTVALAPEGATFLLERGASAVVKVDQKSSIISVLTAGLVTVSRTTKFCFVEDERDVDFYKAVYEILMDHGPSRDLKALMSSPSIAFIAASLGSGSDRTPGGCTVVEKWINKLDAEPLDSTFFGIIDKDTTNVSHGRIHVIGRYSIENYLLDPLILAGILLAEGVLLHIPNLTISSGDEHQLRHQPETVLQAVVDHVTSTMESIAPALRKPTASISVTYTIGKQVQVPTWVVYYRGHDLLPIAEQAFGGNRVVNPPRLLRMLRRCRLVPVELATLLRTIQGL